MKVWVVNASPLTMKIIPAIFEEREIRRLYDEKTETWFFSVVDIIQVLTQQADFQTSRKYWNKLKERLGKEGSQLVTNCHRLKLPADDGKMRLTDVANAETLLRLVQSVPSPKAEPIKLWLAKVGYERMQEMTDALLIAAVLVVWPYFAEPTKGTALPGRRDFHDSATGEESGKHPEGASIAFVSTAGHRRPESFGGDAGVWRTGGRRCGAGVESSKWSRGR